MTQKLLKDLFDYNPNGYFIEKTKRHKFTEIGKSLIVSEHHSGYRYVRIFTKKFAYHRLIFLWHFGYLPENTDHKNRNRADNRIENLRSASEQQNRQNASLRKDNKSGYRGVYLFKGKYTTKWRASIRENGRIASLGLFNTKEEAAHAYDKKAKEIYGEFSSLNFT